MRSNDAATASSLVCNQSEAAIKHDMCCWKCTDKRGETSQRVTLLSASEGEENVGLNQVNRLKS